MLIQNPVGKLWDYRQEKSVTIGRSLLDWRYMSIMPTRQQK